MNWKKLLIKYLLRLIIMIDILIISAILTSLFHQHYLFMLISSGVLLSSYLIYVETKIFPFRSIFDKKIK